MPAYVIAEVDVTDPEAYKLYASRAPGITQPAGGKYLARAGHVPDFGRLEARLRETLAAVATLFDAIVVA